MRLVFEDFDLLITIIGTREPGRPPWKIGECQPHGCLKPIMRQRYPTLDALVLAVRQTVREPVQHALRGTCREG